MTKKMCCRQEHVEELGSGECGFIDYIGGNDYNLTHYCNYFWQSVIGVVSSECVGVVVGTANDGVGCVSAGLGLIYQPLAWVLSVLVYPLLFVFVRVVEAFGAVPLISVGVGGLVVGSVWMVEWEE